MSKNTLARMIRKEIDSLNWEIDVKIVRGLPYKQEARRHKFLTSQLRYLSRAGFDGGFFGKTAQLLTSFVL